MAKPSIGFDLRFNQAQGKGNKIARQIADMKAAIRQKEAAVAAAVTEVEKAMAMLNANRGNRKLAGELISKLKQAQKNLGNIEAKYQSWVQEVMVPALEEKLPQLQQEFGHKIDGLADINALPLWKRAAIEAAKKVNPDAGKMAPVAMPEKAENVLQAANLPVRGNKLVADNHALPQGHALAVAPNVTWKDTVRSGMKWALGSSEKKVVQLLAAAQQELDSTIANINDNHAPLLALDALAEKQARLEQALAETAKAVEEQVPSVSITEAAIGAWKTAYSPRTIIKARAFGRDFIEKAKTACHMSGAKLAAWGMQAEKTYSDYKAKREAAQAAAPVAENHSVAPQQRQEPTLPGAEAVREAIAESQGSELIREQAVALIDGNYDQVRAVVLEALNQERADLLAQAGEGISHDVVQQAIEDIHAGLVQGADADTMALNAMVSAQKAVITQQVAKAAEPETPEKFNPKTPGKNVGSLNAAATHNGPGSMEPMTLSANDNARARQSGVQKSRSLRDALAAIDDEEALAEQAPATQPKAQSAKETAPKQGQMDFFPESLATQQTGADLDDEFPVIDPAEFTSESRAISRILERSDKTKDTKEESEGVLSRLKDDMSWYIRERAEAKKAKAQQAVQNAEAAEYANDEADYEEPRKGWLRRHPKTAVVGGSFTLGGLSTISGASGKLASAAMAMLEAVTPSASATQADVARATAMPQLARTSVAMPETPKAERNRAADEMVERMLGEARNHSAREQYLRDGDGDAASREEFAAQEDERNMRKFEEKQAARNILNTKTVPVETYVFKKDGKTISPADARSKDWSSREDEEHGGRG